MGLDNGVRDLEQKFQFPNSIDSPTPKCTSKEVCGCWFNFFLWFQNSSSQPADCDPSGGPTTLSQGLPNTIGKTFTLQFITIKITVRKWQQKQFYGWGHHNLRNGAKGQSIRKVTHHSCGEWKGTFSRDGLTGCEEWDLEDRSPGFTSPVSTLWQWGMVGRSQKLFFKYQLFVSANFSLGDTLTDFTCTVNVKLKGVS